jgi:hypothetical protein
MYRQSLALENMAQSSYSAAPILGAAMCTSKGTDSARPFNVVANSFLLLPKKFLKPLGRVIAHGNRILTPLSGYHDASVSIKSLVTI